MNQQIPSKKHDADDGDEKTILFFTEEQIKQLFNCSATKKKIPIGEKQNKGKIFVCKEGRLCDEEWRQIFTFDPSKLPPIHFCVCFGDGSNNNKLLNDNNHYDQQYCHIGKIYSNVKNNISTTLSFSARQVAAKVDHSMSGKSSLKLYINKHCYLEVLFRLTTSEMIQKTTSFKQSSDLRMSCGQQVILSFDQLSDSYLAIRQISTGNNNSNDDFGKNNYFHVSIGYKDNKDGKDLKLLLQLTNDYIGETIFQFQSFNPNICSQTLIELKHFDGKKEENLEIIDTNMNRNSNENFNLNSSLNQHDNNQDITTPNIAKIIESKLLSQNYKTCDEFMEEVMELWKQCSNYENHFLEILEVFFKYGWLPRVDVITMINQLILFSSFNRLKVFGTFCYFCCFYDIKDDNNNKMIFEILQQWIEYIFADSGLILHLCSCKTNDKENIIHLMSKLDLHYVKFLYDKFMFEQPSKFIKLLSESNKATLNGLYTSTYSNNVYYVVTWLLERYENLYSQNDNNIQDDKIQITKFFALTHTTMGNILHYLAKNKHICYGKDHTLKDVFNKTIKILQKTNPNLLEQLFQSRIPTNGQTPKDIFSDATKST